MLLLLLAWPLASWPKGNLGHIELTDKTLVGYLLDKNMYCSKHSMHKEQDCLFSLPETTGLVSQTITLSVGAKQINSPSHLLLPNTPLFFNVLFWAYETVINIKKGFVSSFYILHWIMLAFECFRCCVFFVLFFCSVVCVCFFFLCVCFILFYFSPNNTETQRRMKLSYKHQDTDNLWRI